MSPKGGGEVGSGWFGWRSRSYRSDLPSQPRSPISLRLAIPPVLPPVVRWSGSPVKLDLPALPATDSKVDYKNSQTLITPEHSVYPHCFLARSNLILLQPLFLPCSSVRWPLCPSCWFLYSTLACEIRAIKLLNSTNDFTHVDSYSLQSLVTCYAMI